MRRVRISRKAVLYCCRGRTHSGAVNRRKRPDCLPPDIIGLLDELNKIKCISSSFGLQTSNEATGKLIRRGYPLCVYDEAVYELKSIGVNVVTHMIIGLPHETTEDMKNTARHIAEVHSDGIKITAFARASGNRT